MWFVGFKFTMQFFICQVGGDFAYKRETKILKTKTAFIE
jgi:hypothetical protein